MYLPSFGHAKARSVVKVVRQNLKSARISGRSPNRIEVRALAPRTNSEQLHEGRARCANTSGQR
jgi:ethanolamine utilization protein EutQ (cupin superfamily)